MNQDQDVKVVATASDDPALFDAKCEAHGKMAYAEREIRRVALAVLPACARQYNESARGVVSEAFRIGEEFVARLGERDAELAERVAAKTRELEAAADAKTKELRA